MTAALSTVLIVDDNVELAEMTCEIIETAGGVQAVYRTSVTDAMDYIIRNPGTAGLFTDIYLASPMSGIELAVYVAEEWPDIAICVTSGMTAERPKRLPPKAGFLPKPWRTPDLLAFVASVARR